MNDCIKIKIFSIDCCFVRNFSNFYFKEEDYEEDRKDYERRLVSSESDCCIHWLWIKYFPNHNIGHPGKKNKTTKWETSYEENAGRTEPASCPGHKKTAAKKLITRESIKIYMIKKMNLMKKSTEMKYMKRHNRFYSYLYGIMFRKESTYMH